MKNLFRKILRGTSLATALLIFEACYGSPYIEMPKELQGADSGVCTTGEDDTSVSAEDTGSDPECGNRP